LKQAGSNGSKTKAQVEAMKTIEMTIAPSNLGELVELAKKEAGVTLTRSGLPIAQVIPIPEQPKKRTAPLHPGAWEVSDDFDEPLPDEFWLGKA
jgi:antitoxin (DNA-binding transcriptional repressor) of toxin-antitoxin stability system